MIPSQTYWTFDLDPFVFQVKNLNFNWVTTWWGILSLLVVFGGGYLLAHSQLKKLKRLQSSEQINTITKKIQNVELFQTILVYSFVIFGILYFLQMLDVNWGLRWYSTMYLFAFISVYIGCMLWIRKRTLMLTEGMLMNLITFCILGMLVGARLVYVFVYNWDSYKDSPLDIIATWEGGLSFHGGIIGVALAIILYCRKNKIPFFHLTDKLVQIIPLGIAMGRVGNFLNGELWGRTIESSIPWAIIFPNAGDIPRHPSQLYQSLGEGIGLYLTLFIISRWKQREGVLSACFIMFYCLYRFIVEYFRAADSQVNYFYLTNFSWQPLNAFPGTQWWQIITMGQLLCFVFFFFGCFLLFLARKNIREGSQVWEERMKSFTKLQNLEKNK